VITLIAIGAHKDKAWEAIEQDYISRLSHYTKFKLLMLPELQNKDVAKLKDTEGQNILAKISNSDLVIVLDVGGKQLSSEKLAQNINKWQVHNGNIVFVIGSSWGLSDEVVKRADLRLSLSEMTFTHTMARVILLEQIYRGFKILNNEEYHK
jgi:23S rRNA (pseudouridine1915-N3)-methyltransferase